MKVVMSGGTGLIGSALRSALSLSGHETVILSRRALPAGNSSRVFWDAKSSGEWQAALNGSQAVINLCGESLVSGRWNERRKKIFYDSRILSTRAIVAALSSVQEKPKVLINASAIGFYGDRGDEELDESQKPGSDFLAKLCVDWEREAQMAQSLGVRSVCLRMGLVLSSSGGALGRLALPFRLGLGGRLGNGQQWMSWIAIEDMVRLMIYLIDADISGPVNAVSPEPARNEELARLLAKVLKRPAWTRLPRWVLSPLLGELSAMILSSQRALPKKVEASGFKFQFPHLESALDFSLNGR